MSGDQVSLKRNVIWGLLKSCWVVPLRSYPQGDSLTWPRYSFCMNECSPLRVPEENPESERYKPETLELLALNVDMPWRFGHA